MRKNIIGILFAVIWLVFVTVLLCTPGSRLPKINWQDKVLLDKWAHVFLFFVMVILWCRVYKSGLEIKKTFITITILSILYGVAMEVVQHYFIPMRSFDVWDMFADSVGAVAGYFISIKRFLKTK